MFNSKTVKIIAVFLSVLVLYNIYFDSVNNKLYAEDSKEEKTVKLVLGGVLVFSLILGIIHWLVKKKQTKEKQLENIRWSYEDALNRADNESDKAHYLCQKGRYKRNNRIFYSTSTYTFSDVIKMFKKADEIYKNLIEKYKNISDDEEELKLKLKDLYRKTVNHRIRNSKRYYICLFSSKISLAEEYFNKNERIRAYSVSQYLINKYKKLSRRSNKITSDENIVEYYNKAKNIQENIINYYIDDFKEKLNNAYDYKKSGKILEACYMYNQILLEYNKITNELNEHLKIRELHNIAKTKLLSEMDNIYKSAFNSKKEDIKNSIMKYTLFAEFFKEKFKLSSDIKENLMDKYEESQSILYDLKEKWFKINNKKYNKYKELLNKIKNINSQLNDIATSYGIKGEIVDIRSDIEIYIWGVAIPLNNNLFSKGTCLDNSYIVIFYPKKSDIHGNTRFFGKDYYYIGKKYEKNLYGADVPVYMYSSNNPHSEDVKKLESKKRKYIKEFNKLREYLFFWETTK